MRLRALQSYVLDLYMDTRIGCSIRLPVGCQMHSCKCLAATLLTFARTTLAWPVTWRVNFGQTKLRPVHSLDVAHALEVMMDAENTSIGQTFSLGGPRTYTSAQLMQLVESLTFEKIVRPALNVPRFALKLAARVGDLAWWPMLSPDEVTRRYIDDSPDAPGTLGFADLGIEPDLLEEVAIVYLRRYRSNLRFEVPTETGGVRLKGAKQRYNVVD